MKRVAVLLISVIMCVIGKAQNGWRVESTTDDYTMEKSYVMTHYIKGSIDIVYYPQEEQIKVIKDYFGLSYFDTAWDAEINNDGYISSWTGNVFCRVIKTANDYIEHEFDDVTIKYLGFGDEGKITTDGFYGYFYQYIDPQELKSGNYLTFMYYNKISDRTITKKISLAGFTAAYKRANR